MDSNGNVYVTGIFRNILRFATDSLICSGSSDIFLAKFNPAGNLKWLRRGGGPTYDQGDGVCYDGQGGLYVTGMFRGAGDFSGLALNSSGGPSADQIFVVRYDTLGNPDWGVEAGSSAYDIAFDITADINHNAWITGYFQSTATFGSTTLVCEGMHDIFISKISPSGTFLWSKRAGSNFSPGVEGGFGIATDPWGNAVICGSFLTTATFDSITVFSLDYEDTFVAKYRPDGELAWVKTSGGYYADFANSVSVDGSGNIYHVGNYSGGFIIVEGVVYPSAGWMDLYIAKLDSSGNLIWFTTGGGVNMDWAFGVSVNNGILRMAGKYEEPMSTFGPFNPVSMGGYDVLVAGFDNLETSVPDIFGLNLNFSAHPNPVKDQLIVQFTTSLPGTANLSLRNLQLQELKSFDLGQLSAGDHIHQFWLGEFPAGIYFAVLNAGNASKVVKLEVGE